MLCYTIHMPRRTVDSDALTKARAQLPKSPSIAPGLAETPTPAALQALATTGQPDEDGTRYDLEAARAQAAAAQQGGSRSDRAGAPPMLDIIPPSHAADPLPPSAPPELQKNITLNPRLTGLEEADQKVMFQYYVSRTGKARSAYEVGRVFKVPEELVERLRKKYEWDRECTALEDNAMLDEQDEANLHDLVALEMQTITGLQGILGRHNAASASLEQMKKNPRPVEKNEQIAWDAERGRLLHETMSPTMLMNVVDSLMLLKKAKIGQRKRKMGKMYVMADPATVEKLQREFNNRPTTPEPDGESA